MLWTILAVLLVLVDPFREVGFYELVADLLLGQARPVLRLLLLFAEQQ